MVLTPSTSTSKGCSSCTPGQQSLHPNCQPHAASTTSDEQEEDERTLQQIMGLIQQFITLLRSTFLTTTTTTAGATAANTNASKQTTISTNTNNITRSVLVPSHRQSQQPMLLFTQLCQQNDHHNLVTRIQQLQLRLRKQQEQLDEAVEAKRSLLPRDNVATVDDDDDDDYDRDDERLCILYQIMFPLLELLFHYCERLDEKEAKETVTSPTTSSSSSSSSKPPPPPSFLLSLQQYTDVAAFMEVWVCYSVMIHVEPASNSNNNNNSNTNMLLPLMDRCRYALPKSLQGRLPRPSLLWAHEYVKQRQSQEEEQQAQAQQQLRRAPVSELRRGIVLTTRLLLLDRFRPMLLPRHLTDLYAAILQADHYNDHGLTRTLHQTDDDDDDDVAYRQACRQLGLSSRASTQRNGLTAATIRTTTSAPILVNVLLQARTCQTLLRQGAKTPTWVRQRVTPILTHLACHDMAALIQVFVVEASAPTNGASDGTMESEDVLVGASLRLAHAILLAMQQQQPPPPSSAPSQTSLGSNTDGIETQQARLVCQQLLRCLSSVDQHVWDSSGCTSGQPAADRRPQSLSRQAVACIRTVQAVLEQMPDAMLCQYILPTFLNGLLEYQNNDESKSHYHNSPSTCKILRQLGALLALPRHDYGRLVRLFFMPLSMAASHECPPTLLVELLRLASQFDKVQVVTVEDRSNVVRQDAQMVLQLLVQAMTHSSFSYQGETVDGLNVMCIALVHAVASPSDSQSLPSNIRDSTLLLHPTDDYDRMIREMEQRAQWVVGNLLRTPVSCHGEDAAIASSQMKSTDVPPSRFFQCLLWLYFWSLSLPSTPTERSNNHQVQLAVMMMLPLLCEKVPPEYLLLSQPVHGNNDQEDDAILPLVKLILASTVAQKDGMDGYGENTTNVEPDPIFASARGVLDRLSCWKHSPSTTSHNCAERQALPLQNDQPATLLSICSIILSLLVTILELGAQRRPLKQEEMLQSLMPSLERLATLDLLTTRPIIPSSSSVANDVGDNDADGIAADTIVSNAHLAELASHAMGLIASRLAVSSDTDDTEATLETGNEISWEAILSQAQQDLTSDQPPLRARGVVSLRHFIRGDYFTKRAEQNDSGSRICIIEETTKDQSHDTDMIIINRVLQLCLTALADPESFVYLAAIQTIVAAADVNPRLVVPHLARALCTGSIVLDARDSPPLLLVAEQRIKVAEALLFTIRRRASAYEYIPILMAYMVQGTEKVKGEGTPPVSSLDIQSATHEYFVHGTNQGNDELEPTVQEGMDGQSIRVATGGPLFDAEENDLLRASCIQILAELLMVSQPTIMAKYCPQMVALATNALSLDVSRPVRRAAALLSREIYAAASRECDEITACSGRKLTVLRLLTIDLVSSAEEQLEAALERSVASNNLGNGTKTFGLDPATVARCQEALAFRVECEERGIMAAAKVVVAARRQDHNNAVARLVNTRLQEGDASEVVRLMQGGEIDRDKLSLNL